MNRFVLAAALLGLTALAVPALAQQGPSQPQAFSTPTPAPNEFTDPAMTFFAPKGYVKANIPPHNPTDFPQPTVVAAFASPHRTKVITVTMEDFNGSLSGYKMVTENEMRDQAGSVFFKHNQLTTLSNGMPAYWQDLTVGSGFQEAKRYQYVWIDGVRGVVLAITSRFGEMNEQQAKQALSDASAVAFPNRNY